MARFGAACVGVTIALVAAEPAIAAIGFGLAAVLLVTARRDELEDSAVMVAIAAGGFLHSLVGLPWQIIPAVVIFLRLAALWLALIRGAKTAWIREVLTVSTPTVALTAIVTVTAGGFMALYLRSSGTFAIASVTIPAAIGAALFNAILEESIWRRHMLKLGANCPIAVALLGQAASFGAVHWAIGVPSGWVGGSGATLYGLALGVIATRKRSFPLIVCSHWVVDIVIFVWLVR